MLISDATLPDGSQCDIRIEGERIAAVGEALEGEPVIDADGLVVLPGVIDPHVHFREPGDPHKETWMTGTKAAAAGGVTTVVDMPNTDPPTTNRDRFRQKATIAASGAHIDFGINGGVTASWQPDGLFAEPMTALGEVFMADSTGELGIDEDLFRQALTLAADRDVVVTVHAEDATRFDKTVRDRDDAGVWSAYRPAEAEIAATERAIEIADAVGAEIHIAHASTPEAIDLAVEAGMTCEVAPHHMFLSQQDLDELGTYGRMNPPLRSETRRQGVFKRVIDGRVTMIATDHAPHTVAEKETDIWSAPSGVPGVETSLPLLLAASERGDLDLEELTALTASQPADRFGFDRKGRIESGRDADLVFVDMDRIQTIDAETLVTACGWTPFDGFEAIFPVMTMLRGGIAYHDNSGAIAIPRSMAVDTFGPVRGQNVKT